MRQQGYKDVFHIYNIRSAYRDSLRSFLGNNGVKTEIHYPIPPYSQKCMEGIFNGELSC